MDISLASLTRSIDLLIKSSNTPHYIYPCGKFTICLVVFGSYYRLPLAFSGAIPKQRVNSCYFSGEP
nr:MAG TPA: hypothetical protein [Caudoviricetes sp.]